MKIWSFISTQPDRLRSARVLAPDRAMACMVLGGALSTEEAPVYLDPNQPRLGCEVILNYAGESAETDARVLSVVLANGEECVL